MRREGEIPPVFMEKAEPPLLGWFGPVADLRVDLGVLRL
jgi:hypothetical protein